MFSNLQSRKPRTIVLVPGFSVSVTRKSGALLKDAHSGAPASVNEYFEITIGNDGSNTNYPKPAKKVARCTLSLDAGSAGFLAPGIHYWPRGTIITRIRIEERCETFKDFEGSFFVTPEHVVWCRIETRESLPARALRLLRELFCARSGLILNGSTSFGVASRPR